MVTADGIGVTPSQVILEDGRTSSIGISEEYFSVVNSNSGYTFRIDADSQFSLRSMEVLVSIRTLRNIVLSVSLVIPSCRLVASTDGAILVNTGPVQINGSQVSGSSTVFPGDRVQTAFNASALVKSSNALVSISGDSTIKYDGTSVTLEHGMAAVAIAKRMDAHLGKLLISADPGAKFQVVSTNGIERIAAIEGSLTVTDGLRAVKLSAGEMMTHDPSKHPDDAPPLGISNGLPGWAIEVIIEAGVAGGILGGLAAAGDFNSHPAPPITPPLSPSGP